MSHRRTTGIRVLAAREAKELSLRRAARRLGVSPRALRNWEHGREDIPYAVRLAMVTLYGLPREALVPDRPTGAVRDAGGTISIGSVTFTPTGADDDSLRAFLAAVRTERGLADGARLALRATDAALLAEVLGGTPEAILSNLTRLLGGNEREALEFGRWIFRKTALAGALTVGLLSGVAGTATLSASPAVAVTSQVGAAGAAGAPSDAIGRPDGPLGPDWAVIGDAAVLERDAPAGG